MRLKLSKIVLSATFGLALAFTFSCSFITGEGGDKSESNKYRYCVFIQSGICLNGSFDHCEQGGSLSNSCPFNSSLSGSSSSRLNNSSSSGGGLPSVCSGSPSVSVGSLSYQGKTYKTVKIGNQTWMAENLNYNVSGSVCYDNQESNCNTYGRLYNRSAAMLACPSGWHLSSNTDWDNLVSYVENNSGCSSCAGKHLKANCGWNENGNGSNKYGFFALPSGYGDPEENYFGQVGRASYYWEYYDAGGGGGLCIWSLAYDSDRISGRQCKDVNRQFSVRCVQN